MNWRVKSVVEKMEMGLPWPITGVLNHVQKKSEWGVEGRIETVGGGGGECLRVRWSRWSGFWPEVAFEACDRRKRQWDMGLLQALFLCGRYDE